MVAMHSHNVPALRLEGFDGEWELKAIGDLSERTYGGGTPSSDEPGYWSGDIPWIQSSDVAEQGVAPVAPRKHITKEAISRSAAMQIPADSVAVVTRVGVGKVSFMPFPYATSQDFVSLSDLSGDPEYIALTVKRRMEGLADQLQGSTIKGITKTELLHQAVYFPPTLEEQQAIGAIFTNLDAAINQHTKKHQALQQAKTALMQRMFPQEGQTVPELRLEGFDGEWKSTTLGELGTTYGGLSGKNKDDFGHGDAMYVTYKDIFSRPLITDTTECERVEVDTSQNEVRYGDVFFTTSSEVPEEVGLSAVWLVDEPNVYLNSFCFGFRPTGDLDLHYLGYVLRSLAVRSQFLLLAQGISRFNISKTKAVNISLYAPPTLEEQQAIGAVFTRLDTLIATEAKYIESLKQTKTALLQRMFI